MKKFFKTLMMCLVIIPCVFVLAACGGDPNQVKVNTSGNYKESSMQAFNETIVAAEDAEQLEFNAYRMSYKMSMKQGGETVDMVMHATIMLGEGGDVLMYASISGNGEKLEYYVGEEYVYMNMDTEGTKMNYKMPKTGDFEESLGAAQMALEMGSVQSLLDEIAGVSGEVTVKSAVKGTTTKYQVSFEAEGAEATVWFVFENGTLTGIKSVQDAGDQGEAEMQMERFTGTSIAMPKWTEKSVEMAI